LLEGSRSPVIFLPVIGATGATTSLKLATGLDFIDLFGSLATPGVDGVIQVNSASDDFVPLVGASGTIKDFTFSGIGSTNFPVIGPCSPFNRSEG
jgi:hypothetical protein